MTDGYAMLTSSTLGPGANPYSSDGEPLQIDAVVEAWNPYPQMFSVLWNGKRHVVMGGSQIDKYGNQNFACIGDWHQPEGAVARVPRCAGQHDQPRHELLDPESLTEGLRREGRRGERGRLRPGPRARASGVAVLRNPPSRHESRARSTSRRRTTACACGSVHPGVTIDEVVAATGFELVVPDDVPDSRVPTDDELQLLARGDRSRWCTRKRGSCMTDAVLHTRACELFGVEYPIIQTGMGWVAGARLTAATSAAGGLGIIASATMTLSAAADRHS